MSEHDRINTRARGKARTDVEHSAKSELANKVGQASGNFADESNVEEHPELKDEAQESEGVTSTSEEAESDRSPSGEQ